MNEPATRWRRDARSTSFGLVIGERTRPDARRMLGLLLSRSRIFDLAVNRVRLAAIDFTQRDLASIERCRVLIGGFDNAALLDAVSAAAHVSAHARNLGVLREFLASGRLEIRSAGAWRWNPDFCVADGEALRRWFGDAGAGLVGNLGLGAVPAFTGPRLSCFVCGRRSLDELRNAFAELWDIGRDVHDVVAAALGNLDAAAVSGA